MYLLGTLLHFWNLLLQPSYKLWKEMLHYTHSSYHEPNKPIWVKKQEGSQGESNIGPHKVSFGNKKFACVRQIVHFIINISGNTFFSIIYTFYIVLYSIHNFTIFFNAKLVHIKNSYDSRKVMWFLVSLGNRKKN